MVKTCGIYEAKATFSALVRFVQESGVVIITQRGKPVVKMIPAESEAGDIEARLQSLIEAGEVQPAQGNISSLALVAKRNGALSRFLRERE